MFKTKIVGILFILSAVTMFSVQTLAASCGDFSGTYKGSMSNSNYAVSATDQPDFFVPPTMLTFS
jgi:hypothetical protein